MLDKSVTTSGNVLYWYIIDVTQLCVTYIHVSLSKLMYQDWL